MLGLEMPFHHQQAGFLLPFSPQPHDADHHPQQQPTRNAYVSYGSRRKQQVSLSPEGQPGFGVEEADVAVDGAKRGGPQATASRWQRMKWTDTMVRLLITVVYCVGDEGGGAGADGGEYQPTSGRTKNIEKLREQQQKKGKWKSVSRAMMERGYYVSPQQCEDKCNDLNKRYKRVNELLGRGTACRVVENQALLDTMDHLSPKAKEETRKHLNSKHLFFPEMCAYHNNASYLLPPRPPHPPPDQEQQQVHFLNRPLEDGGAADREEDHPDDDEVNMEEDEDDDQDDVDDVDGHDDHGKKHGHQHHRHHRRHGHEEGDEEDEVEDSKGFMGKRPRKEFVPSSASPPLALSLSSVSMQQLRYELMGMAAGEREQQRQWLRRRASELEKLRVGYQCRALKLEWQRFRWLRFSGNKEWQMERMKLENESLCLENKRMLLLLRLKELELISCSEGASSSADEADPFHQQQLQPISGSRTARPRVPSTLLTPLHEA